MVGLGAGGGGEAERSGARRTDISHLKNSDWRLIERVWRTAKEEAGMDVGVEIFLRLLRMSPSIRQVFAIPDQIEPRHSGRLISHARIVKNQLDAFVSMLVRGESVEAVRGKIRSLGARHVLMRAEGFTPEYWIFMAQALEEIGETWEVAWWRRWRFRRVWGLLVGFIVANMRIGYRENLLASQAAAAPPAALPGPGPALPSASQNAEPTADVKDSGDHTAPPSSGDPASAESAQPSPDEAPGTVTPEDPNHRAPENNTKRLDAEEIVEPAVTANDCPKAVPFIDEEN